MIFHHAQHHSILDGVFFHHYEVRRTRHGTVWGVYVYQVTFLIFTLVKEGVPALLACRVILSFVSLHASVGRVAFFLFCKMPTQCDLFKFLSIVIWCSFYCWEDLAEITL